MTKVIVLIVCILCLFTNATIAQFHFIPEPTEITMLEGTSTITAETAVMGSKSLQNEMDYLAEFLPVKVNGKSRRGTGTIFLDIDVKIQHEEAYQVFVNKNSIKILGRTPKGVFNGIQTLLQMMPSHIYNKEKPAYIVLPNVRIYDEPKFQWRGLLLDCSRHFMEKEFVLRYIDLLAYHKMNTLHWHITEDQGWRIEIKKYPKLTEVGAWRKDVNDEMEDELNGDLYGGFYTQEDIKEIVAYAAKRHINIVPEIEMPGHCQAALAAYPEYSCTGGPFEVETEWGVFKEIYCAGNPATYTFLTDILDEVLALFPSKYIHIGGDEVPKFRWEHCDKCKSLMDRQGLADEEALQSHFLGIINEYLKAKGRVMVGWDEIAEGGLPENAIVQSWRGMEGAIHAIEYGHETIVSPTSHAYFDYDLKSIDLAKVYSFDPIPKDISPEQSELVLGGECNMWSERAPQETVDSKVFPRLLALSEVLWSYPAKRDYDAFYEKAQAHYKRLETMGVDYGFEGLPFTAKTLIMKNGPNFTLSPSAPNIKLEYQLDNGEWQSNSSPLLGTFEKISIRATKNGKPYGEVTELHYHDHMMTNLGDFFELEHPYSESYDGGNPNALIDGWKGSTDFKDGHWQGFWGTDLIANFNLTTLNKEVKGIKAGFLQYNNSWIFMPTELIVEVSEDGINFEEIGTTQPTTDPKERGRFLETLTVEFEQRKINYLRVTAKNVGKCPDWHDAAGSDAWLFADEIEVY